MKPTTIRPATVALGILASTAVLVGLHGSVSPATEDAASTINLHGTPAMLSTGMPKAEAPQWFTQQQALLDALRQELASLARETESTRALARESTDAALEALALGRTLEGRIELVVQGAATETLVDDEIYADGGDEPAIDVLAHDAVEARMAELESNFDSEFVDEEWSAKTAQALQSSLASDGLSGSALVSTQCRETMCMAVVEHESDEDLLNFDLEMPRAVAGAFGSFIMRREELGDGWHGTTVYMARDAAALRSAGL